MVFFDIITTMQILETLTTQIDALASKLEQLNEEKKLLQMEIDELTAQQDILKKNNENMLLNILSRMNKMGDENDIPYQS